MASSENIRTEEGHYKSCKWRREKNFKNIIDVEKKRNMQIKII
jgi:hypothetical protein